MSGSKTTTRRGARVPEEPVEVESHFYCRARRRREPFAKCLDDYVNAKAFARRRSACWRCPQGRANRGAYADS